ncbi:YoaK family protein [Kitasatospora sp. NPDC056138]|uniref:YoaK family protein n=1 Tax=Kitasatospora sp. NPDC056138 TaxID=3345724 RepID=UPI0035E39902
MPTPSRVEIRITVVLTVLTVTSGVIDALSFLGLGHAFAALATGNLLLLAFGIAGAQGLPVARPAVALAGFLLGAAGAQVLVGHRLARGRRWFMAALLLESATICAAGLYTIATAGAAVPQGWHATVVFVLLTAAMGWRSRVVFEARIPDMPTTLAQTTLVKMITDIAFLHGAAAAPGLTKAQRLATVLGMFVGGVVGAAALPYGLGAVLLAVAGCIALVALAYSRHPHLRSPAAAPRSVGGNPPGRPDDRSA